MQGLLAHAAAMAAHQRTLAEGVAALQRLADACPMEVGTSSNGRLANNLSLGLAAAILWHGGCMATALRPLHGSCTAAALAGR